MTLTYDTTSTAVPQAPHGGARRLRVAIVYPFFAHYRAPLLHDLLVDGRHEYLLVGDVRDPSGGIPTMDLHDDRRFVHCPIRELGGGLVWQRGLVRLAWRNDIDCFIYLGNALFLATWLSAIIASVRGRRVLFWTHGWTRRERGLKASVRTAFYRLAHGLLLYGHRARQIGMERGFAPATLQVVYNSLDLRRQQELRSRIGVVDVEQVRLDLFGDTQTPVVLAVGRLTPVKKFDLLIDAAAALGRSSHRVNVLIVGSGPAEPALRKAASHSNTKVVFYGPCYDEPTLARLFASANVTVSPGNVGLTCVHSLGYGVPVITHDDADEQMPEWEAITADVSGSLFARDSVEDLAAAIRRWTATQLVSEETRRACLRIIETSYNPTLQRQLIEQAAESGLTSMRQPAPHAVVHRANP